MRVATTLSALESYNRYPTNRIIKLTYLRIWIGRKFPIDEPKSGNPHDEPTRGQHQAWLLVNLNVHRVSDMRRLFCRNCKESIRTRFNKIVRKSQARFTLLF